MNAQKARRVAQLLLGAGLAIFILNSGMLGALPGFIWISLLFVAGGFFWLTTEGRLVLWQRSVGFAMLGVLAMVSSGDFAGSAALGFPALAFLFVYLSDARRWWALIPGGVLGSLALLVTAESLFPRWDSTPILFLGFAATFSLLYLLPKHRGGKSWALYPAIFCILLTVAINDPGNGPPGWLLPLSLIAGGAFGLWWWRKR